jgi:CheY-like chemotaxis protein
MPKKVLIVEDEKPLSHALALKLQHEGLEVSVAYDGQECLNLIAQQQFDVLLLDLVMPVLDGFQVLEKLQHAPTRPTAIFVLSNLSQSQDEQRVRALGARKFFIKSDTALSVIVDEIKNL